MAITLGGMTLYTVPTADHGLTHNDDSTRISQEANKVGYSRRALLQTVLWCVAALLAACIALVLGLWLKSNRVATNFEQGIVDECMKAVPPVVATAKGFAVAFSVPVSVAILVVILALMWLLTRSAVETLKRAVIMGVPLAFALVAKLIVTRPRPITAAGLGLTDWSFPSGHTACSVVVALSLIALIRMWQRKNGQHRALAHGLCLVAPLIALATAYSRLVLGVHFPSDVLTSLVVCSMLYGATGSVVRWYRPAAAESTRR